MSFNVADLSWLPSAPADFRARLAAIEQPDAVSVQQLKTLAARRLDTNQLHAVARKMEKLRATNEQAPLKPLVPFHIGLISDSTTDLIAPALAGTGPRHGLDVTVTACAYGQVAQAAFNPVAMFGERGPDAILLSVGQQGLPLRSEPADDDGALDAVRRSVDYIATLRQSLHAHYDVPVIVANLARSPELLFGSLDFQVAGTNRALVNGYNAALTESLRGSGDLLLDVAALAETIGLGQWHDAGQWFHAKLPFAQRFVPIYADMVCRVLGAMRGKSRKVVVLDLDNTVWGGVIGDDGLAGIRLGQGSAEGEAFVSFQKSVLDLRSRGIVIAVSSKNNDAAAIEPFRSHPEMVLREEHIAVFQANWSDKATNLEAIAGTLSLGLDSLVLVDDNPAEREQVRQALPDVAVPELPEDPAYYTRVLYAAGYFEAIGFTADDRMRARAYEANLQRASLLDQSRSLEDYLKSLDMRAVIRPFDAASRVRVVQLINKSNQFNLTTRRTSEPEILARENDPASFGMHVRLIDRFGDNGIVSIVICDRGPSEWSVDTWVMSCRVLGRTLERTVLDTIARAAISAGAERLVGTFLPSGRNELVRNHYRNLGFAELRPLEGGSTEWVLDLRTYASPKSAISVDESLYLSGRAVA